MPWKESHQLEERLKFVIRLLDGERMTDLCREFDVSRKTGYKILSRYQKSGLSGLEDQSKAAFRLPHRTGRDIESLILKLREERPTWGAKKLKVKLEALYPGTKIPASSTIGSILDRNGYLEKKRRRREKTIFENSALTPSESPNEVWCIDFKGQFRMANGQYCYPLTVTDHFSRYLLGCEALENTRSVGTFSVFREIFETYGLPNVIRSDNGVPFATGGICGLSELSAWFIRLGIKPERIKPGHPEQNGRHERMHRTLKKETTRPPGKNLLHQQEKFDRFQKLFNEDRPHESLQMKSPAEVYRKSSKILHERDLVYPLHDYTRMVGVNGRIRLKQDHIFISKALRGNPIGLKEIDEQLWEVEFGPINLGYIDLKLSTTTLFSDNPRTEL